MFHRRAIKKLPRRIRPLTAFMTVLVTAILVFLLSFLILRQEKESFTIETLLERTSYGRSFELGTDDSVGGAFEQIQIYANLYGGRVQLNSYGLYPEIKSRTVDDAFMSIDSFSFNVFEGQEKKIDGVNILLQLMPEYIQLEMEGLPFIEKDKSEIAPPYMHALMKIYVERLTSLRGGPCDFVISDDIFTLNLRSFLMLARLDGSCPQLNRNVNDASFAMIFDYDSRTVTSVSILGIEPSLDYFTAFKFSDSSLIKDLKSEGENLMELAEFNGMRGPAGSFCSC